MEMVQITMSLVGVIGTLVAIYQWAVLNESKKRRSELQFLLASVNQLALSKQLEWNNQLRMLPSPKSPGDQEILRLHVRARDNSKDISALIAALESVIDTDSSAISEMLKKSIEQTKLNNDLQKMYLENPTQPSMSNTE